MSHDHLCNCRRNRHPYGMTANHIAMRGAAQPQREPSKRRTMGHQTQQPSLGLTKAITFVENTSTRGATRSDGCKPKLLSRTTKSNVVTINCRLLKSRQQQHQLCLTLNSLNASIACLQETRLRHLPVIDIPAPLRTGNGSPKGYRVYTGNAGLDGTGGCGIAVSLDLAASVTETGFVGKWITWARLSKCGMRTVWIVSAHAPTEKANDAEKDTFDDNLLNVCRLFKSGHYVIVRIDGNAQYGKEEVSTALGRWHVPTRETTANGRRLLDFCEERGFVLASTLRRNTRKQRITWKGSANVGLEEKVRRKSATLKKQIDYVLISKRWAHTVTKARSVWGAPIDSDHAPVSATIKLHFMGEKKVRRESQLDVQQVYRQKKIMTDYRRVVARSMAQFTRSGDVTLSNETFTRAVLKSAITTIPLKPRLQKKPFLSQEAECLATKAAKFGKTKCAEAVRARRALRRQLQRDEERIWRERVSEMEEAVKCGNMRKFYSLVRIYSGKATRAPDCLTSKDGRTLLMNDECLERWRGHFQKLLNRPRPSLPQLPLVQKDTYPAMTEPPTLSEITTSISKLKRGKAAGDDDVYPDLIKFLPPSALQKLQKLLQQCWETQKIPDEWRNAIVVSLHKKGSVTDPENYRGISLLPVVYKVLERIIADRLCTYTECTVREEEAGSGPGRSTVDHIFAIRRMIEQRNKYGQSTYIAVLDFACAFDSPCRERIYDLLRADGVPSKNIHMIKDMISNTTVTVRTRAGTSRKFLVDTGVRQGSVLAPMLYNYVIDEVMRRTTQDYDSNILLHPAEKELTDLEYADDIALVADNPRDLQKAVTAV
ncbi:hypothetical protein AB6A40_006183 [Gnathostoma spinigerum]|uniref:Reverse transcriptase domain-containing protein n=1 Tax=Gnathostoma spinigerum TaxID=75299 RepID=A0ABD6EQ99_9BILA